MIPIEQFWDEMFKRATGWLGWPPDVALRTPIGQISLALDGQLDFLVATNPYIKKSGPWKRPPPREVQGKLRDFLRGIKPRRRPAKPKG